MLAVYSLVNSFVASFPAVRRVQILVDGRPVTTLAGHIDLTRPLSADMTLVVEPTPQLEPAGAAEGPAPAGPSDESPGERPPSRPPSG